MTKDDDRDRRIPSLLRGSVEECDFRSYSYCTFYCIIVVPPFRDVISPFGDIIDALGHVKVLR